MKNGASHGTKVPSGEDAIAAKSTLTLRYHAFSMRDASKGWRAATRILSATNSDMHIR